MLAGFNSLCRADVCSLTAGEVSLFSLNGACFLSTVAQRSGEHDRRLATMADVSVACLSLSLSVCLSFCLSLTGQPCPSLSRREKHIMKCLYFKTTNKKSHMCGVYSVLAAHSLRENLNKKLVFFAGFEEIPVQTAAEVCSYTWCDMLVRLWW